MDFLQQLSQNANLFDSKEEILNVPVNSIFYALHNDLSTISSTRTSRLKLDNAEYKDILENFKERLSKNWFSICSLKMYICYRQICCLKGYLGNLIHLQCYSVMWVRIFCHISHVFFCYFRAFISYVYF